MPDTNFPADQISIQQITQKINNLLNNPPNLQVTNTPQIPDSADYQSNNFQKLRFLTFTQTPNDSQLFTTTPHNSPLTVIFDSQLNIRYIEILGGYQTLKQLSTTSPISYSTLQQIANQKAQRLPTSPNLEQENQLNSSSRLNLTVQDINLSFFFDPQNPNILQPVYSLTGPLSTNNLNFPQSRFIVPALPENLYQ